MYHGSANWAKQVLGFDVYTQIPIDGRAFGDFMKARGFRKGKDIEWFAAAILRHHALILRHYVGKDIPRLGRIEKEFDRLILKALKHQDIDTSAQEGGGVRGAQIKERKVSGHAALRKAAAKIMPGRSRKGMATLSRKN
jgi:hypothetical protein